MRWVIAGLFLLIMLSRAAAQETPATPEQFEQQDAIKAYDQAILKFNSYIKAYPSWEIFKAEVLSRVPPGTMGRCYTLSSGTVRSSDISREPFRAAEGEGWYATSDDGWRRLAEDRTFMEYRVNEREGLLLRLEGVKPRFFFASARRLCEFPLVHMQQQ